MKQVTLSIEVLELALESVVNQKKSLFRKKKELKDKRDSLAELNDYGSEYQYYCFQIGSTSQKINKLIDAEIDLELQLSKIEVC